MLRGRRAGFFVTAFRMALYLRDRVHRIFGEMRYAVAFCAVGFTGIRPPHALFCHRHHLAHSMCPAEKPMHGE